MSMHRTFSPSTDWQTPTSITLSHIDRMERDLRTLRRDLFDHPREMTGACDGETCADRNCAAGTTS
jgi:hypothetical protein